MMLWIVSDLHIGRGNFWAPKVPDHDVMVIAGDVAGDHIDTLLSLFAMARWSEAPIVFAPGNHDYFGVELHGWDGENRRLNDAGVHVLSSGQSIVIDGVRFVGATLWTDFGLVDRIYRSESWAARHMPEYQNVLGPDGGNLWPIHTSDQHVLHLARIEAVLADPFAGPTVVVTHHAPSPRSCWQPLEDSAGAFASDLEDTVRQYQPELWVHGHIHSHSDYHIGSTRILANPRGYQSPDHGEDSDFIEDLVVEV